MKKSSMADVAIAQFGSAKKPDCEQDALRSTLYPG
jgi:hypothetical protein